MVSVCAYETLMLDLFFLYIHCHTTAFEREFARHFRAIELRQALVREK